MLNMEEPKRRKPNAKDFILYDFIYKKFPENTNPGQQISGTEQGLTTNRYNVTSGGMEVLQNWILMIVVQLCK